MPKHRAPYPPEFRQQLIELVWAGRSPHELSKEFEASAQSIRDWVAQAERDRGKRKDGLTSAEREGLTRLRHELAKRSLNGTSWQKPRPGSPRRGSRCSPTSRAGTTHGDGTRLWAACRQRNSRGVTPRPAKPQIPARPRALRAFECQNARLSTEPGQLQLQTNELGPHARLIMLARAFVICSSQAD